MECAIKLNVSSTIIVLFQFQKNNQKTKKKNHYKINGELYKKDLWGKDVKLYPLLTGFVTFNVSSINII